VAIYGGRKWAVKAAAPAKRGGFYIQGEADKQRRFAARLRHGFAGEKRSRGCLLGSLFSLAIASTPGRGQGTTG